jgi:hypothetical protein
MVGVLPLLALIFSLSARAEEPCDEFRLDGTGGPMEHVDVRDQDANGICYAVSLAEFYDSLRFGWGDRNFDHQTSALYIANTYRESGSKVEERAAAFHKIESLTSGYSIDYPAVLMRLAASGSCSENQMRAKLGLTATNPSSLNFFTSAFLARFTGHFRGSGDPYATEREAELNHIYSRYKNTVARAKQFVGAERAVREATRAYDEREQKIPRLDGYGKLYQDRRNAILYGVSELAWNGKYEDDPQIPSATEMRIFSNLLHSEFQDSPDPKSPGEFPRTVQYLDSISKAHSGLILKDYGNFLQISSLLTCSVKDRVFSPKIPPMLSRLVQFTDQSKNPANPNVRLDKVGASFRANLKRHPVVTGVYCFPYQKLNRQRLLDAVSGKQLLTPDECGGAHAVVVLGRQKNPKSGSCEYLIRNSWGRKVEYQSDWYTEPDNGIIGIDVPIFEGTAMDALTISETGRSPSSKPSLKKKRIKAKSYQKS